MSEIVKFGIRSGAGSQALQVRVGEVKILVEANDVESQPQAEKIAERIAKLGAWETQLAAESEETRAVAARAREYARTEVSRARAIAAACSGSSDRASFLGAAVIREDTGGNVWLLGNAEKGWGAFGFRFDSWAELARERPDVRVCGVAVDATGPYALARSVGDWPEARVALEVAP